MKRNISDMMNEISEETVRLREKTPLSAKTIRQRTMTLIGEEKQRNVRRLPRAAVILAAVLSLLISACAADTAFNEGRLFGGFFGLNLSDKQIGLLDDMGRTYQESVSSNGTTITLLQAVADEDTMYLHLRVESPEGVILPDLDDEEGYYYSFSDKSLGQLSMKAWNPRLEEWEGIGITNQETTALKDEDPTDNVKEFVIRIYNESDDNTVFNDPRQKIITLKNLCIHKQHDPYQQKMMNFDISFDVTMENQNQDKNKIVMYPKDASFRNEEYGYTITIKKVMITPLRLVLDCSSTQPSDKYIFPHGGPVEMVMKDGTKIHVLDAYYDAREYPRPDDVAGAWTYAFFDSPVVVQDIDYLIFNDDVIVDVN